jgi:HPr kinase/phosphorylase
MEQLGEQLTVEALLREPHAEFEFRLEIGGEGLQRVVPSPRVQKPGLALSGFPEQLQRERVQILGGTEIQYLNSLSAESRQVGVDTLMSSAPACVVITRGLPPPEELARACEERGVALLVSELVTGELIARLGAYLDDVLAPSTSIHGVLLDVLGVGVLLLGKSGIGKSEAALDLLVRGHRLVADDIVNIRRRGPNLLYGSGSPIIRHHMEIRGLGIINIQDLFGISSVRDAKKIELVMELAEWKPDEEYERLGLDDDHFEILRARLPKLKVPVRPGRSIATIIEVAARNQLLKFMGHHAARAFQDRLNKAIAEARPLPFDTDAVE